MPNITKQCVCWNCKETMVVGTPFRWVEGFRWAPGPKIGGSGTIQKYPVSKPAHINENCAWLKSCREQLQLFDEATAGGVAFMKEHGHDTPENMAQFLDKRAEERKVLEEHYK